jgi:uncharacterized protein YndB with AHSA1/START domain
MICPQPTSQAGDVQLLSCGIVSEMEPVVLTRDVLLDMPVDDLWRLVADPDGLRLWLGDSVELDVRPGGVGTVQDDGRADGDNHSDRDGADGGDGDGIVVRHVRVDRVEPAHELAFTWWRTDDPHTASQASQVVFHLTAVPGGSHLHITETLLGPSPAGGMTATAFAGAARTAWEVRVVALWTCSVAVALV